MSDIRDRVCAEALACQSYRAGDPATLPAFQDLIGPGWDLSVPYHHDPVTGDTHGCSTCALVAAGILRRAGVLLPWVVAPTGSWMAQHGRLDSMSRLSQLGYDTHAIRPEDEAPIPGDLVCQGTGLQTHVYLVTSYLGASVISVDGGQVDPDHGYLQRVALCHHAWPPEHLVWIIDVVQLAAALEAAAVYP